MPNIKYFTKEGLEKIFYTPYCIGDIVTVTSAGNQYDTYESAFEYFWGSKDGNYHIPYNGHRDYKPLIPNKKNLWTIINIAVHQILDVPIYYLRSQDRRKIVMGENGMKFIKHGAIRIIPDKVIQLCQ